MSLVDYASSDEDEAEIKEEERENFEAPKDESQVPKHDQPTPLPPQTQKSSNEPPGSSYMSEPSVLKLPDASLLLNATHMSSSLVSGYDHSSRVAAAMAECESRKREASELASSVPRGKVPRGALPNSRNVQDTVGGLLVPPQLSGRSNIVTEDIGKLFVRRNADPSSH
ncbi:hypothetical protein CsSME_00011497 [Camellia sinensis var. sinensis]|nr:uncharacterized protein LOC114278249 isoform X3 [Camellia sinensis]